MAKWGNGKIKELFRAIGEMRRGQKEKGGPLIDENSKKPGIESWCEREWKDPRACG